MISINGKKKEKKKKKKKEEEAAADNEGMIGNCVGNLLAAASTGHRSCFVVFLFFLFFFFLGTCLLLLWFFFFSLQIPLFKIWNYQISFHIHRKSWNKKKPFEPQKPVMVHKTGRSDRGPCGSLLFWHGTVLHPKQTIKLNSSRFFWSYRRVQSGFQNLASSSLTFGHILVKPCTSFRSLLL